MPKRGKPKTQKYQEAVERNLANALKRKGRPVDGDKYNNKKLEVAKNWLGIRQSDTKYDSEVRKLIGKEDKSC